MILPKPDEASNWKLQDDDMLVVLTLDSNIRRYKKNELSNPEYFFSTNSLFKDNTIICYSDYKSTESITEATSYRTLIRDHLPSDRRVFRHFGGQPLADMRVDGMKADMKGGYDPFWEEENIMPYSIEGGNDASCKWLPIIREIRDGYFNASTLPKVDRAIEKLDEAWDLATKYFNIRLPKHAMLEALFPLYLTLSGDSVAEDKAAAISATKKLVQGEPLLSENNAEGFRLIQGFTCYLPDSPDQATDFIDWFLSLSKDYTKELGFDEVESHPNFFF